MDTFNITLKEREFGGSPGSPVAIALPTTDYQKLLAPDFITLSLLNYYSLVFLDKMDVQTLYTIEHIITGTATTLDTFCIGIDKKIIEYPLVVYNFIDGIALSYYSGSALEDMLKGSVIEDMSITLANLGIEI